MIWPLLLLFLLCQPAVGLAQEVSDDQQRFVSGSLLEDIGQPPLGAAELQAVRPLLPVALNMIKEFEQWQPNAYNDPAGFCTIGYGHLISLNRCEQIALGRWARPLTEAEGIKLLNDDTASARLAIQRFVSVDLDNEEFGALTSFVFNIGKGNFFRSTLLRLLNDERYELAEKEFARWIRSRGKVMRGLIVRRSCEATLFAGYLDYPNDQFNRNSCGVLGIASDAGPSIDIETGE
ncbi:MAG: lysozyme [Alphaproteobacteria bacterium]